MPFEIVRNDITRMKVDAIVNAANRSLLGGGGVDGAIHAAAGPELKEECRRLNGCETGEAKITGGYRLPARYVIHTVGPVWQGGGRRERELLSSCYTRSLELAAENHLESVAFPLISAGAYGYPKEEAMEVAVEAITRFLLLHDLSVYLVVFGRQAFFTGKKLFRDVREYIDDRYVSEHFSPNTENARKAFWQRKKASAPDWEPEFRDAAPKSTPPEDTASAHFSWTALEDAAPAPSDWEMTEDIREAPRPKSASRSPLQDLKKLIRQTDEGFSQALLRMIDERGMTDAQCYKKANVDRRLFSKIRSDPEYRPSKPTVFAFVMALELSLPEAKEILRKAGFALTRSSRMDLVIEYCISHRIYDVLEINEVLYELDLPLLGNSGNVA